MIAAVEIVIDIDLPVTLQGISLAREEMDVSQSERRDACGKIAEECLERGSVLVQRDEDEVFPDGDAERNEAVLGAVEVADAGELGHAYEGAIEAIGPAVIGTAQMPGGAAP